MVTMSTTSRCIFLGLQLVILLTVSRVQGACQRGWREYGTSCYLVHTHDKYDWMESSGYCGLHKAHLATIETADENNFIKTYVKEALGNGAGDDSHVWIGGTDDVVEDDWRWVISDRPVANFTDWFPGEPNSHPLDEVEDCLVMWADYQWQWADLDCHEECFYICEKESEDAIIIG